MMKKTVAFLLFLLLLCISLTVFAEELVCPVCGAMLTDGHLQVSQTESTANAENPFKILGNVVTYGYYEQDLNFLTEKQSMRLKKGSIQSLFPASRLWVTIRIVR